MNDSTHLNDSDQRHNPATQAWQDFLQKNKDVAEQIAPVMRAYNTLMSQLAQDPQRVIQMQMDMYKSSLALWANLAERSMGYEVEPLISPTKEDRRFSHELWQSHLLFDFIKQSYLLIGEKVLEHIAETEGVDAKTQEKLAFYTRSYLDALSPSNFPLTNPDVLQATVETNGQNLIDGLNNMLSDLQQGRISMTDYEAFEVGKNLATTPGQVVFRNHLFELIQYQPTTEKVHETPLLIAPPWINRYYILDLREKNSFIKYVVDQGFQVFLISWKNPDASYAETTFEDYIKDGLLQAANTVKDITNAKSVNALGYCIGGTMLATALAALAEAKESYFNSATFFTTLMDFSEAGELGVFIDEDQVAALERKMAHTGYLEGREMASTFSALRSNDLIWSFVVNNYMLGKQPFPFDILYWNDDPTRLPAAMHSWYLRNFYLENNLIKPGKIEVLGKKVNLQNINLPVYMVSGINDHITPWESCFSPLTNFKSDDVTFTLSKAGHVAGVVNPPTPEGKPVKRAFWSGKVTSSESSPSDWLEKQSRQADSWWPHYSTWLANKSGELIDAPKKMGNKSYPPLLTAPGTYVHE